MLAQALKSIKIAKEIQSMNSMKDYIRNYLEYCQLQKCLDEKTLKAYRIDLRQFSEKAPHLAITE